MKKWKFYFSPLVWALLVLVNLLFLGGVAYNIYNVVSYASFDAASVGIFIVALVFCLALSVFSLFLTFNSKYTLKKGALYTYFGLIKRKTDISEIDSITHFKKSDKLVLYFNKGGYVVIVIYPKYYDEFIKSIREEKNDVTFSWNSEEEAR